MEQTYDGMTLLLTMHVSGAQSVVYEVLQYLRCVGFEDREEREYFLDKSLTVLQSVTEIGVLDRGKGGGGGSSFVARLRNRLTTTVTTTKHLFGGGAPTGGYRSTCGPVQISACLTSFL